MITDAASLGRDRVLLAASVASLPQEPLGPGGCCLVAHAPRMAAVPESGSDVNRSMAWKHKAINLFSQLEEDVD